MSAAFRFGHTLLPSTIERWSKTHRQERYEINIFLSPGNTIVTYWHTFIENCDSFTFRYVGSQKLSEMLQQPYDMYKPGWSDAYIMGLINQVKKDPFLFENNIKFWDLVKFITKKISRLLKHLTPPSPRRLQTICSKNQERNLAWILQLLTLQEVENMAFLLITGECLYWLLY